MYYKPEKYSSVGSCSFHETYNNVDYISLQSTRHFSSTKTNKTCCNSTMNGLFTKYKRIRLRVLTTMLRTWLKHCNWTRSVPFLIDRMLWYFESTLYKIGMFRSQIQKHAKFFLVAFFLYYSLGETQRISRIALKIWQFNAQNLQCKQAYS